METRLDYQKAFPEGVQGMLHLEAIIRRSGIEPLLYELVKIRASQLNGCAYCIDMHTKDARAKGETEQRIYALSAWHEGPFFTERERAAPVEMRVVQDVGACRCRAAGVGHGCRLPRLR